VKTWKSAGTARLIAQYAPQIEADLAYHYHQDLRDLWRPNGGATRLTWRRVGVLIERLPPESALKTAIRDAQGAVTLARQAASEDGDSDTGFGPYSNTDMHIAALIDEIRWLRHAIYHAQGAKPKKPHQYPRPGVMPVKTRKISTAGRTHLAELRAERARRRATLQPADVAVPTHIADTQARKLGPAEKQWITDQLAQLRAAQRRN
jgi:hypothetical protein